MPILLNITTPEMVVYNKKYSTCKHEHMSDFSFYQSFDAVEKTSNFFCPDCRTHFFKDREWTPDEWDAYNINETFIEENEQEPEWDSINERK